MCANAERILRGDDIRLLPRFIAEDGAQDLVEYALLAAFIGIAGWAVLTTLPTVMGATYGSWMDPDGRCAVAVGSAGARRRLVAGTERLSFSNIGYDA